MTRAHRSGSREPVVAGLDARELDVLRLVADGATDGEIAAVLGLEPGDVPWLLDGLLTRLGARNPEHAVSLGFRLGILTRD